VLFNSFQFLIFFSFVWVLVLVTRGTVRRVIILIASYYFYMCWSTRYIWVIWGITLLDYFAGQQIAEAENPSLRRFYLYLSLFCNIGLLVFFKYFNFLTGSVGSGARLFGIHYDPPLMSILLPVGLSFHTFQAMSYTIEVYRRKVPAEKNLLQYALYVAFFPQMVAGPIERPSELLPQFHREPRITLAGIQSGLVQAAWGLFKKIVIADNVADFVKLVYGTPRQYNGTAFMLATTLFAIQIYCDFSGYTDMALGLARMMGYDLRINFRQPYFSRSVGEFWHRWHISLSTWFRDYVYIPLGGNRVKLPRHQRPMAWSELDFCGLGLSARLLSDRSTDNWPLCRPRIACTPPGPSAQTGECGQDDCDFWCGDFCMDLFPRQQPGRCLVHRTASAVMAFRPLDVDVQRLYTRHRPFPAFVHDCDVRGGVVDCTSRANA
jgi:alginate O-acetyltransferase complex protein AlgI